MRNGFGKLRFRIRWRKAEPFLVHLSAAGRKKKAVLLTGNDRAGTKLTLCSYEAERQREEDSSTKCILTDFAVRLFFQSTGN